MKHAAWKYRLCEKLYCNPQWDRKKLMCLKCSFDEVCRILNTTRNAPVVIVPAAILILAGVPANEDAITDSGYQEKVLNCPLPVLVEFFASWCPKCAMMDIIWMIAAGHEDRLHVVRSKLRSLLVLRQLSISNRPHFCTVSKRKTPNRAEPGCSAKTPYLSVIHFNDLPDSQYFSKCNIHLIIVSIHKKACVSLCMDGNFLLWFSQTAIYAGQSPLKH